MSILFTKVNYLFVGVCWCWVNVSGIRAQEITTHSPSLTLQECLTYAVNHQPALASVKLDQQLFEYQSAESKSEFLPSIHFFSDVSIFPSLPTTLFPGSIVGREGELIPLRFGDTYNLEVGLMAHQLLFDGRMISGKRQQATAERLVQLKVHKEEEDLLYQIALQYIQLLQTQTQAQLIPDQLKRLKKLEEIVALNQANGNVLNIERKKIALQLTSLNLQQKKLSRGLFRQYQYLRVLMGMDLANDTLLPSLILPELPIEPVKVDSSLISQTPEYQLLAQQQQLTHHQLDMERATHLPVLSLNIRHSYQAQRGRINFFASDEDWFTISLIGLHLQVPIFNGFASNARSQQLTIKSKQQSLHRKHSTRLLTLAYENAYISWSEAREMFLLSQEELTLAKEQFEITRLQYQEGITLLSHLLDMEANLRQSEITLIQRNIEVQQSLVELLKAGGKVSSLIAPVSQK